MYPQKLYRIPGPDDVVVNSDEEKASAVATGYTDALPAKEEYPKALYLHPVDKTQEHKAITVKNADEQAVAEKDGYQVKPHNPVTPEDTAYEGHNAFDGSGSERWPNSGWTESGDGTNYPGLPNQSQADAVVAQGQAELTERRMESEGKPGVNEFTTSGTVAEELASEGKPGVNET